MAIDPSQYLRMKNLFDPGQMQTPDATPAQPAPLTMPQQPPANNPWANVNMGPSQSVSFPTQQPSTDQSAPPAESDRMIQMMHEMYHPETQATDKFTKMMDTYPKRSENEPSVMRRIGGALQAVAGGLPAGRGMGFYKMNPEAMAQGEHFMDKPFEDKLTDWKNQIGPTETAANMERYHNTNERTMAYQTISAQLKDEAQKHREANDERNAKIKDLRAQVYQFKALHPGAKFDWRGPTALVGDPITGEVKDTGVSTGHFSDLEKMTLGQENLLERMGAQAGYNSDLESQRQGGREVLADKRGEQQQNNIRTRGQFATGAGGKPETPTQTRVRQFNAARQLVNTRPEFKQFIKLGNPGSNDFLVAGPSDSRWFGHSGPTPDQYKEMQDFIYGQSAPKPMSSHNSVGTVGFGEAGNGPPQNGPDLGKQPPQRPSSNNVEPGRIPVYDNTGKATYSIPDTPEQRDLAIKHGLRLKP